MKAISARMSLGVKCGMIVVLTLMNHFLFAQRTPGELNVSVEGGSSRQIDVTAQTTVFGTKDAWYPQVDSLQGQSGQGSALNCYHIDRGSAATYTIGYAVYKISIGSYYIYVDWRDADYSCGSPYVNTDVRIHFDPTVSQFHRVNESGGNVSISNGATTGVWECGMKGTGATARIPVTVTNNFGGGQVSIASINEDVPYTEKWTVGTGITIAAISPQTVNGLIYQYSSWSDGYGQSHTVTPALSQFGSTFTANFTVSAPVPVTNLQVGGNNGENVHLTWTIHPNGGVNYYVYRKVRHDGVTGPEVYVTTLAHSTTSWDDPDWIVAGSSSDRLYYDVRAHDTGSGTFANGSWVGGILGVPSDKLAPGDELDVTHQIPQYFALDIYPNPFNPTTSINVDLPEAGLATLGVYDLLGKEVSTLAASFFEAGRYQFTWSGSSAASGVYYARLTVASAAGQVKFTSVKKLLLTK